MRLILIHFITHEYMLDKFQLDFIAKEDVLTLHTSINRFFLAIYFKFEGHDSSAKFRWFTLDLGPITSVF
jgi:hypothetical protein